MDLLPDKLVDCTRHGQGTELVIVEGDSAARSVKRVRAPEWQAVLPMQGKPMNGIKAGLGEIRGNHQLAGLIAALGANLQNDHECDTQSLRYERIVLLFDPDADGIHSRTLLLLFFYRWLRPLLDAGRVFDTYAPRWAIQIDESDDPVYAFSDEDLKRVRRELDRRGLHQSQTTRFRGLGSVGAEALSKLCLDPATRRLVELSAADAEAALALFEQLRELGRARL